MVGMGMHSEAGALLVAHKIVTEQQLQQSLTLAIQQNVSLIQSIIQLGFITESRLASFLSSKLMLPMANETQLENLPGFLIRLVPIDIVKSHCLVPIMLHKGVLHVAMADPTDRAALEAVAFATGYTVSAVIAEMSVVQRAVDTYYGYGKKLRENGPSNKHKELPKHSKVDSITEIKTPAVGNTYKSPFMNDSLEALFRREVEQIAETSLYSGDVRSKEIKPSNIEDAILFQAQHDRYQAQAETSRAASDELTPIYDFETARNLLGQVDDRDQVARVFVRFTLAFVDRSILFMVKKNQAVGWIGAGEGIKSSWLRSVRFSFDLPSVFKTVRETGSEYFGSLPKGVANDTFIKNIGGFRPKRILLIPIHVHNKLICMLYADCGRSHSFTKDLSQMHIMIAHVCKAFEELVVKSKLLKASDQPM